MGFLRDIAEMVQWELQRRGAVQQDRRAGVPTFVRDIEEHERRVRLTKGRTGLDVRGLRRLGARRSFWSWWTIWSRDEQSFLEVLDELRALGVPFMGQPHGWPAAEIFAHLRERGLVREGSFLEITWRGPGDFVVRDFDGREDRSSSL